MTPLGLTCKEFKIFREMLLKGNIEQLLAMEKDIKFSIDVRVNREHSILCANAK